MGVFDFFSRRRRRESAIPPSSSEVDAPGSFAASADQPVVGRQVGGGGPDLSAFAGGDLSSLPGMVAGLKALSNLGPTIEQAIDQGSVERGPDGDIRITAGDVRIEQDAAQTIDLRGTALAEEIRGILREHGIDPESGATSVDPGELAGMQQQIFDALGRHGIDPNGTGEGLPD